MFGALFEIIGELIAGLLQRLVLGKRLPPGPVKSAALPPGVAEAIAAALKAGQDPAAALPRGWRGFTTGLTRQFELEEVGRMAIGADLQLAIEGDYVRVDGLGYLPPDEDLEYALTRGRVRCWLADRRPTSRYADGAALLFIAVYDPR